jgi:hypothetical protein
MKMHEAMRLNNRIKLFGSNSIKALIDYKWIILKKYIIIIFLINLLFASTIFYHCFKPYDRMATNALYIFFGMQLF